MLSCAQESTCPFFFHFLKLLFFTYKNLYTIDVYNLTSLEISAYPGNHHKHVSHKSESLSKASSSPLIYL